jgi:ATP-dependent RNA helicase DHX36
MTRSPKSGKNSAAAAASASASAASSSSSTAPSGAASKAAAKPTAEAGGATTAPGTARDRQARRSEFPTLSDREHADLSKRMVQERTRAQTTTKGTGELLEFRKTLPAYKLSTRITELCNANQCVIISGETGSGKTTQVGQFILDNWIDTGRGSRCRVLCTQPRRISAMSVADRVAAERGCRVGAEVGYQVRLDSKKSAGTRLLFMTTGILLRRLIGDPDLDGVTHVIVDEVHERTLDGDFLLIILRDLLKRREDLVVVVMSATLNADLFAGYFGSDAIVAIAGRTHPVDPVFLEDVLEITEHVIKPGSDFALKRPRGGPPPGGKPRRDPTLTPQQEVAWGIFFFFFFLFSFSFVC